MNDPHPIFGPDFVLATTIRDDDLNFSFEIWTRNVSLPDEKAQKVYLVWQRQSPKNRPELNRKIQVRWVGDRLI